MIKNTNYEKNDNYIYNLLKMISIVNIVNLINLCNRQDVNYSIFEEDIYEC